MESLEKLPQQSSLDIQCFRQFMTTEPFSSLSWGLWKSLTQECCLQMWQRLRALPPSSLQKGLEDVSFTAAALCPCGNCRTQWMGPNPVQHRWPQKVTKHSYIPFDTKGKLLPTPLGTAPEKLCGCHFAPPTWRGNVNMLHLFSALCHHLYLLFYCKTSIRGSTENNVASNLYMRNFNIF